MHGFLLPGKNPCFNFGNKKIVYRQTIPQMQIYSPPHPCSIEHTFVRREHISQNTYEWENSDKQFLAGKLSTGVAGT